MIMQTSASGTDIGKLFMEMDWTDNKTPFRSLVEVLPVAIYTCDMDGRITFYNEAAADLWGRHPEVDKDLWSGSIKMYKPNGEPLSHDACPMAIALKEGRAVKEMEVIIERPDGTRKNILPHPRPFFDAAGKQVGAMNMLLDISERKNSEKETNQLAAIVQSSQDAIISKTLQGIITSWNPAAEKLFGYTSDEMIGKPITLLIPPDRLEEEPKIIEKLKRGETVEHFETKRVTKDGRLLDISLTISPLRDKSNNIFGASKIARNITAQKALHDALFESEERFRMASESAKIGTWEFHPLTQKLIWSDECKKIYGLDLNEEPTYELVRVQNHPEDQDHVNAEMEKILNPDHSGQFNMEYRIYRKNDGKLRWIKVQGKMIFENQQPVRFIGTMLDITKEKEEAIALKDSVELFQTMADNVPAMIWMSGTDKFNDYFNKTWLSFRGRAKEEEENEGWLRGVHPADVQKCTETYKEALAVKQGFYTEYRLLRYDGKYRWIADNCVARYSPQGEFVGFISACIDIDDQKNFREKIEDSELQLKTISNASPVGLWMTDENGYNTFVNDTWIEWTGMPAEDHYGTGWLDRVMEEDKIDAPAKFQECMAKREKYHAEFRLIGPDGELRWCLTEGSPFYDTSGNFAGYAGSVTDITEIKKLEERKDDFIKMASHELKTPITSIKGYVQLLLNIYNESSEEKLQSARNTVKSSLSTISKQVSKLTRLVSELLDLTRIESGKLELHKTQFDPGILIEETVQDVRQTITRHAIIIDNDFTGMLYADRDRISQVLLNLLTNAIKYSPDSDHVEVKITGDKKNLVVSVTDHGIGIDKKEQSKIFERFYRVEGKSEQTYPGFGIGLFIASEIIQRHHGSLTVNSEKGKGSVFTFTLPIIQSES